MVYDTISVSVLIRGRGKKLRFTGRFPSIYAAIQRLRTSSLRGEIQ